MKRLVVKPMLIGLCIGLILSLVFGTIDFVSIQRGEYKTPWYDASFRKDPVTHAVLWFYPSETKVATNAVGHLWLVKETTVGDKTYWTRLKVLKQ
jgi:hypothetical protein